jgi:hypothetical protein
MKRIVPMLLAGIAGLVWFPVVAAAHESWEARDPWPARAVVIPPPPAVPGRVPAYVPPGYVPPGHTRYAYGPPAYDPPVYSAPGDGRWYRQPLGAPPSQPGRVLSIGPGYLLLDPYEPGAGDARLTFGWHVPVVWEGGDLASAAALRPGADVMVYYREQPGLAPSVVRVELLSPERARDVEWQYLRNTPYARRW